MKKTLLKTVTLGTNRFPYENDDSFEGMPKKENAEEQLLSDAAFHLFAQKAGKAHEPKKVDFIEACLPETKTYLSEEAMYFFRNADNDYFLNLFIELANKNNKIFPPTDLPNLINSAIKKNWTFNKIEDIAGERGKWLIGFNKKWEEAFGLLTEKDWETAKIEKRVRFLKQLRATDLHKARSLFQETASQESVIDLTKLIACFSIGLSEEDEPILAPYRNHKRKSVRLTALQLLFSIPNAAIIERYKEYSRPFLNIEKNKKAVVSLNTTLPKSISAAMEEDGILEEYNIKGLGKKASILMQLIGKIPPTYWQTEFNTSVKELTLAAENDNYDEALLLGWSQAAAHHKNIEWASVLLESLTKIDTLFEKVHIFVLKSLVNLTPSEKIEEIISNKLEETTYLQHDNIGLVLMKMYDKELSSSLTLKFFNLLLNSLKVSEKASTYDFKIDILGQLKTMVHLFPTKTLTTLKTQWLYTEIPPTNLNPVIEAISNLEFKQKMQAAINNQSK